MTDAPKRLVSTVHVHRRDPKTGAVLETVVVENKTLRKALRQHPWLEAELAKEDSAHVWELIPQSEDDDDEPYVTDAGNSGGRVKGANPSTRIPSAFSKEVEDGQLDPDATGAGLGGENERTDGEGEGDKPDKPSKSASTKEWAEYAAAVGVTVGEDAKRADIIEAVERAEP